MKKIVLKFDLPDDDIYKTKALDIVWGSSGVDSVSVEIEEKKLTVTGDIDVVEIESKLRKICPIEIVYVGPANEPEKKKEEAKKFGEKNDTAMSNCTVEVDCGGELRNLKGFNPQTSTQTDATALDSDNDGSKSCVIC